MDEREEYKETYGKRYLHNQKGELEINITLELLDLFKEERPEFIGHKRILQAVRVANPVSMNVSIKDAIDLHHKYPGHIVGFDLVAEEGAGNSYLYFLYSLLSLYEKASDNSNLPLYLHTAETSWPSDITASYNPYDPVSSIENAYEAILLGAKRIGHGLGFINHPYLLNVLKKRQVAIEICPVRY